MVYNSQTRENSSERQIENSCVWVVWDKFWGLQHKLNLISKWSLVKSKAPAYYHSCVWRWHCVFPGHFISKKCIICQITKYHKTFQSQALKSNLWTLHSEAYQIIPFALNCWYCRTASQQKFAWDSREPVLAHFRFGWQKAFDPQVRLSKNPKASMCIKKKIMWVW